MPVHETSVGVDAGVPKSASSVSPFTNVLLPVKVIVPLVVEALNIGVTLVELTFICTLSVPVSVRHEIDDRVPVNGATNLFCVVVPVHAVEVAIVHTG